MVTGSEDGVIGVASNLKAAYAIAVEHSKLDNNDIHSYAKISKLLRTVSQVNVCTDMFANATASIIKSEIHSRYFLC